MRACGCIPAARSAELQQRASDLQRALAIAKQAREEDRRSLQTELDQRERLLLSTGAENELLGAETRRLKALLQVPWGVSTHLVSGERHLLSSRA